MGGVSYMNRFFERNLICLLNLSKGGDSEAFQNKFIKQLTNMQYNNIVVV